MKQLTIVGAGWAGLSAAVAATQAGWRVNLFESARQAGGRARSLPQAFAAKPLDNGQHILIGAYHETLALMRVVGVNPDVVLQRAKLDLRFANGDGLRLPDWPHPLHLLAGIGLAKGWTWRDKACLIQAARRWQRNAFVCDPSWTVLQLCEAEQLTDCIQMQLIEPLCLSALNTPLHQASATVFLRVLHDALMGEAGCSDLLMPRVDLGALFSDACLKWLEEHGAVIHLGTRMTRAHVEALHQGRSQNDVLLLACSAWEASRLMAGVAPSWSSSCAKLSHAAIATVYLHCQAQNFKGLQRPMMALHSDPDQPAQFVFDKGALTQQPGLLAAVVSACTLDREAIAHKVRDQVRDQLGLSDLEVVQTVVEKRATFMCSPQQERPESLIMPGIWACGDYLRGPYPSTLEGAVRSGQQVIAQLMQMSNC
jgi:squalene-associated FAD-dependent desaturase